MTMEKTQALELRIETSTHGARPPWAVAAGGGGAAAAAAAATAFSTATRSRAGGGASATADAAAGAAGARAQRPQRHCRSAMEWGTLIYWDTEGSGYGSGRNSII